MDLKIQEIYGFFKSEVSAVRGSRPSPALFEDVIVECYGGRTPLKHLGSISVILPREIQISVWDASIVPAVVKAVSLKLNLNASNEGSVVHVNLPSLTQERRDELSKIVRSRAEEARVKSRTLRDDIKKEINNKEKEGEITEDERFKLNESIQKLVDKFNKDIDEAVEKKIEEINE